MPSILVLFLMILGLVLLGLSAVWNPPPERPKLNWQSAGLFCWLLAEILIRIGR
jgi:hypothetical protein